jgi:hypothetical protein
MVTPSGSFMAEVAVTPDTDEVVGAITASMEIENQNEVRAYGAQRPTEIGARALLQCF